MIELVHDLVGLPYLAGGRLPGRGVDCFGLVVECCRRIGRPIPDPFTSAEQPMDVRRWIAERLGGWRRIDHPVAGGVVELRSMEHPAHLGFLLDELHFLHSLAKTGSVVGRLDRDPWLHRIEGYYVYGA